MIGSTSNSFYNFRQLEQFEQVLVLSEIVRLRRKFGSQRCSEDRKVINLKMENFHLAVKSRIICQGKCSSRSVCPTHTCRSPRSTRSFNIFRSRRSSSSSEASVKRRKSLASHSTVREGAELIRGGVSNNKYNIIMDNV